MTPAMSHYFGVNTNTINIIEQPKEKKGEKINSQKNSSRQSIIYKQKIPQASLITVIHPGYLAILQGARDRGVVG
jgi:hypothetical protein